MKKRLLLILIATISVVISINGCDGDEPATSQPVTDTPGPTDEPTPGEPVRREAAVDSIEVQIMESFPVQVNVRARGDLPDGCTTIEEINTTRDGSAFTVRIMTIRDSEAVCTEALVPFEETISLDVIDLPAGNYTVSVNGINGSFTLSVDNTAAAEPTAEPTSTPEPVDSNMALVNGRVWHDLCAISGGEGGEPAVPSGGCIATADGSSFQANGLLEEEEPGLEGVLVNLGAGECPSTGLASITTDADGDYVFTDLGAGTYCVSIDALAEENALLLPGGWTFPDIDVSNVTVTLEDGEVLTGVNFGWDYQFLPVPEVDAATCTNSIEFVQDLNIPDDTIFAPGAEFEKGWRLRNNGTCPWTTEYSLVFVGGDTMSETTAIPLSGTVVPGQTVDLTVTLTAPDELGTYRSNWQLSNAAGNPFGIDGFIDEAFWVQIIVGIPEATAEPNSAVIGGVVWDDFCSLTTEGNPTANCVEIGENTGNYRGDGSLNSGESRLAGITVKLAEGACPEDAIIPDDTVITTTVTDEAGLYRFTGLDEGVYCVAIEPFSEENVDLLIPGDWTWPALGVGLQGISLAAGEERLEVDFGWDFLD